MTRQDIVAAFEAKGIFKMPLLLEDQYDSVELEFLQECWGIGVQNLPSGLQQLVDIGGGKMEARPLWVEHVFDCNKIDRWFFSIVEQCQAAVAVHNGTKPNQYAVGPLSYLIGGNPADGHDINWFLDGNGHVRFFEPQTGEEVTLSDVELKSVFFEEA